MSTEISTRAGSVQHGVQHTCRMRVAPCSMRDTHPPYTPRHAARLHACPLWRAREAAPSPLTTSSPREKIDPHAAFRCCCKKAPSFLRTVRLQSGPGAQSSQIGHMCPFCRRACACAARADFG